MTQWLRMQSIMNRNRRDFVKNLLLSGSGFALLGLGPTEVFAKHELIKITILHTNDVHSRIDPFPSADPKYPNMGGAAQRGKVIESLRVENPNTLLLDCGDYFQGTPYFNLFKGEVELKVMSALGYDAATIGNHDFDLGVEGLAKQLHHANFPILISNYNLSNTQLAGKTKEFVIIEKNGIKIGIFGIGIELDGLVPSNLFSETEYLNPISNANRVSAILKKELKCNVVVCLSHLGFEYKNTKISDKILACESHYIDMILGGHTHTFLNEPWVGLNKKGKKVTVHQVGHSGIKLGKIDLILEANGRIAKKRFTEKKILNKQ